MRSGQITCVSDDVVEHDEALELQLKVFGSGLGQRLRLEAPQPVVGVLEAVHEQLE